MALVVDGSGARSALRVAFVGNAVGVAHIVALSGHRLVAIADGPVPEAPALRVASMLRRRLPGRHGPLAELARHAGATVLQFAGDGEGAFADGLARARPDVLLCAGWPRRLGARVLAAAPRGAFNVHPSLLPRRRGPNPCAWTLLAGETMSGVTVHRMTARFDSGPVVAQREVPVLPNDTQGSLLARCLVTAVQIVPEVLDQVAASTVQEVTQDASVATSQTHPTRLDFRLDFALPARVLHDRVRAALPAPGPRARVGRRRIRVLASAPLALCTAERPGTVERRVGPHLRVATGDGVLLLTVDRRSALGLRVGQVLSPDT